jgi:hypothetical protein
MKLTEIELQKLEDFIGYGKPGAKIVFMGLEEAGGGRSNLKTRLGIDDYKYLDCKDFHINKLKHSELHSVNTNAKVKLQPVWKFMSYIMLRLKDERDSNIFRDNCQMLRDYQNNLLGTTSDKGETLLTEIFPIPCSSLNKWGNKDDSYTEIIPYYKDKKNYKEEVFPKRQKIFKQLIQSEEFQAQAIICYGKTHWSKFKALFNQFNIEFEKMNLSKPCEKANLNKTTILLIPFLGNGQVSYKFLEELVKSL